MYILQSYKTIYSIIFPLLIYKHKCFEQICLTITMYPNGLSTEFYILKKKPGMLISHMNKLIYKSQKNVSYSVLSDSL